MRSFWMVRQRKEGYDFVGCEQDGEGYPELESVHSGVDMLACNT